MVLKLTTCYIKQAENASVFGNNQQNFIKILSEQLKLGSSICAVTSKLQLLCNCIHIHYSYCDYNSTMCTISKYIYA